ncbi:MAG TPA: DUF1275 family protein, partial [Labilithrix sp.]|nr:DUF1275 family protein [Labilithrix sp.]
MLFTASAGFVNAGAVMACETVVSHITGSVTNLAADEPRARDYVLVTASFIGGAMLAVLISETFRARPKLAFSLPVFASFGMLVAVGLVGKAGWFGPFGAGPTFTAAMVAMLAVLGAAMGMVNAAVANATNQQIRVAHLTGPATDLAGNLVRAALGTGKGTTTELRWASLRFAKVASFGVGAAACVKVSGALEFDVFIA